MEIRIQYPIGKNGKREPLPKQREFHESTAKFRAYVGGIGSGKTIAGCMEGIKKALMYPGSTGLIAANTFPQLEKATKKTFFELCPPELIKRKNEWEVEFTNDSKIYFINLSNPDSLRGPSVLWIYMDEAADASEFAFLTLMGRLRNDAKTVFPESAFSFFITSNPNGKNWVYQRFFAKPSPEYFGIQTTTFDNKSNLPDNYIENLQAAYSSDMANRFLHGSFDVFIGQIFGEFQEPIHVIAPIELPKHYYRFRAIDFGWSHPTVVLWACEDHKGNLYFYREFAKSEVPAYELAEKINTLSGEEEYEYTVGDTSGVAVSQTDGESVYRQLYEYGKIQVQPAYKQNKMGRIDRAKTMFRYNKIFIFNTCTTLIAQLPQYQWEAPSYGQAMSAQRPLKINDDAIDAFLYLLGSRPDAFGLPDEMQKKEMTQEERMLTCDPNWELAQINQRSKNQPKVHY